MVLLDQRRGGVAMQRIRESKRSTLRRVQARQRLVGGQWPQARAAGGLPPRDMLKKPRARMTGGSAAFAAGAELPQLLGRLHGQMHSAGGMPLNALVLRGVGGAALAACSRACREFASIGGRRISFCIDDGRGPPYAPLDRIFVKLVDVLRLGGDCRREGERVQAVIACNRATTLACNYGSLTGLGLELNWGGGLTPCLGLRRVRFRQCSLTPGDVAQLLRCTPRLEVAVFIGESLSGLGDALLELPLGCPELRTVDFNDCDLTAGDATTLLQSLPQLRCAHFQAMHLAGLRAGPAQELAELSVLDCGLSRADVAGLMACFPGLQKLRVCGNPLGQVSAQKRNAWPRMLELRQVDLRHCELTGDDVTELRAQLPPGARVEVCTRLWGQGPDAGALDGAAASGPSYDLGEEAGRHVVFDSDSSSESEGSD